MKIYAAIRSDILYTATWSPVASPITALVLATSLSITDTPPPLHPRRFYHMRLQ